MWFSNEKVMEAPEALKAKKGNSMTGEMAPEA
jgi:hypothetical protein